MTSYTFNTGIPAANNDPSADQPDMLTNNQSTNSILSVDHVTFNSTGSGGAGSSGGQHLQVTFNGKNVPAAQTDPISTLYTNSGTASTKAELFFRNQDGTFVVNPIKAFGVFTTQNSNGVIALDMGYNVVSITASSNGQVNTVSLTAGAVNGTTVIVLSEISDGNSPSWTYALNTLTLTISNSSTASKKLSFAILQV